MCTLMKEDTLDELGPTRERIETHFELIRDYQEFLAALERDHPAREEVIDCLLDVVGFLREQGEDIVQIEQDILARLD
jgi:hypothetical protein